MSWRPTDLVVRLQIVGVVSQKQMAPAGAGEGPVQTLPPLGGVQIQAQERLLDGAQILVQQQVDGETTRVPPQVAVGEPLTTSAQDGEVQASKPAVGMSDVMSDVAV